MGGNKYIDGGKEEMQNNIIRNRPNGRKKNKFNQILMAFNERI
jgi:hypothetical protein